MKLDKYMSSIKWHLWKIRHCGRFFNACLKFVQGRSYIFRDEPEWFVKRIAERASQVKGDVDIDGFYEQAIQELHIRKFREGRNDKA